VLSSILQTVLATELFAAAIRSACPIAGAAVGETIAERGGVINIGLEGMMLTGAFCGVLGSMLTGSVWGGLLFAVLSGALAGALHAFLCVTLKADEILSGIAINFAALGLTTFLNRTIFGRTPEPVDAFEPVAIPVLSELPILGPLFFNHIPLVYILYAAAPVAWFVLFRTRTGLRLRSIGEDPAAASGCGVPVKLYRYGAMLVCGSLAGASGAYASLGNIQYFTENMTAGNGFIALAVVIVGRWNPLIVMGVALLFGAVWSLALRGQGIENFLPYEILLMLPYVLTLVAYFLLSGGRQAMPAALGQPDPGQGR